MWQVGVFGGKAMIERVGFRWRKNTVSHADWLLIRLTAGGGESGAIGSGEQRFYRAELRVS
jgi:hypothetical protein